MTTARPDRDDSLDVVVLAGGRSRRLGTDKALVDVAGARQVDRVVDLVASLGGRVLVARGASARAGSRDEPGVGTGIGPHDELPPGVVAVADPPGMSGPLAGIVAGLEAAGTPLVAIVAVDLVRPSVDLLRALAAEVVRRDLPGAVPVVGGRGQHLHAVVRRDLAGRLATGGVVAAGAALAAVGVVDVPEARWRAWAPDAEPGRDIDTPADLARARDELGDG